MALQHLCFAALLSVIVSADQSLYGQCGGVNYAGSTVCVVGATCSSENPYFYQCVAATATSATSATSVPAITTSSSTVSQATTVTTSQTSFVASSTSSAATSSSTQYFITFGDSYSQTDFDINGTLPSAANPIGNPPFPGYTTSGGANWIDLLVSEYNLKTLLSYNFAYGGATTDADLVAPYEASVLSFVDQVTEFSNSIASHPSTTPWTSDNTLFGVWMGVNDVGNIYYESNATVIMDEIMVVYFDQLQILYDAGARNFVLLSVPPIQETPFMLDYGADVDAQEAVVITEYNDLLATNLANFTSTNTGVTAKLLNTTIPFQTVIDDPTAYGAANATCFDDDGTTCVWWNNYHPALAIHELVAAQVAEAWKGSFFS